MPLKQNTTGKLISFEGSEGSGKSTQITRLAEHFQKSHRDVITTREPGGTALGAEVRRIVMHLPETPPTPLTELLLYLADRAQHVAEVITPALTRGQLVLTDRFSASTIAYQGYARGQDIELVRRLDAIARQGLTPHLTILLDCPVADGLRRARGSDRFHSEDQAFHERVRAAFLEFARQEPDRYCVIDATRPEAQVQREVMAAVRQCLERR